MFSKNNILGWARGLSCILLLAIPLCGQKFLPDDPVSRDRDDRNVPAPKRYKLSDYYDFFQNTFGHPGDRKPRTAMNINTLGEVPESAWYTNRHARRRMTIEELVRGPDQGTGPAPGTWKVLRGKNEGVTPGFSLIADERGDRYAIKFDPPGNLEMASSADVIGTKFFYAMGYFVPENYIVYFRAQQLELGDDAIITNTLGQQRKMDQRDIHEVLNRVAKTSDGRYRAVASKILPGQDMGPFRYYGTRPDDPNDIFPHEHRRELRGLWPSCAWLNHDDSRAINTLDMLVNENGKQFIRHHLIDFGSLLGSGSTNEQKPRAGNEYLWEPGMALTRMVTLGLYDRHWIHIRYPVFSSIGRIEGDYFRPEKWKPEYPNPALLNSLPEDAYWGAKLVAAFTDEEIRKIVQTGQISDKFAEEYLVKTVIKRRDKVARYWLNQINSVDRLEVQGDRLKFEDLAVQYGVAKPPSAYTAEWLRYDNANDRKTPMQVTQPVTRSPFDIPGEVLKARPGQYYTAQIRRKVEGGAKIPKAVHVYLRREVTGVKIVGIEREE
jgi:hypothetical protein